MTFLSEKKIRIPYYLEVFDLVAGPRKYTVY